MRFYEIGLTPLLLRVINQLSKGNILFHTSLKLFIATVTIGGFKAGHAAQPCFNKAFTQRI